MTGWKAVVQNPFLKQLIAFFKKYTFSISGENVIISEIETRK